MDGNTQMVRVVGPVIAQIDQLDAALKDAFGAVTSALEEMADRIARIESRPQPVPVVNVPAPIVNVPAATVNVPPFTLPDDVLDVLRSKGNTAQTVVAGGGRRDTRDFYGQGELIPTVTATTSSVTLTQKAEEWWFRAEGGDAYIDPFGGTADADAILIDDGQWHPLNVKTDTVSIYAPSGVTVSGYALRYIGGA